MNKLPHGCEQKREEGVHTMYLGHNSKGKPEQHPIPVKASDVKKTGNVGVETCSAGGYAGR